MPRLAKQWLVQRRCMGQISHSSCLQCLSRQVKISEMKKMAAVVFMLMAAAAFIPKSLDIAASKKFWVDEAFEITAVLKKPVFKMLIEGVDGSPSTQPIYYMLEREAIKSILQNEKESRFGYDWKVSFRFFPSVVLAVGIFFGAVALWPLSRLAALLLPLFFAESSFALLYGAETRVYSFWLALSLLFYVSTIVMVVRPQRIILWIWSFLAIILAATISTSPAQILSCAFIILFLTKKDYWHVGITVGLGMLILKFYGQSGFHLSFKNIDKTLGFYFQNFSDYVFPTFDGMKAAVKTALMSFALLWLGLSNRKTEFKKLYFATGLLGFSQICVVMAIYVVHNLAGYFFYFQARSFYSRSQSSFAFRFLFSHLGLLV